jgi:hypothetical protein
MYRVLWAAYHRNALREQPGLVPAGELVEERGLVAEIWEEMLALSAGSESARN